MAWWEKSNEDGWISVDTGGELTTTQSGSDWLVLANGETLKGTYAGKTAAHEAARVLCQGIDPTTITGG